ncbi:MAG: hypothetical protein AAGL10_08225 [Pseudomonadota bacterium]
MKKTVLSAGALALAFALPLAPAIADDHGEHVVVNEEMGVPVFPYDITDKPYTIVGPVSAGVRKATIFSKEPSQQKIYNEVWERGEKMGADAVVNVTYGESKVSLDSWGKTRALGFAVKFLTEEEIAAGVEAETAPSPDTYDKEMFKGANKRPKKKK